MIPYNKNTKYHICKNCKYSKLTLYWFSQYSEYKCYNKNIILIDPVEGNIYKNNDERFNEPICKYINKDGLCKFYEEAKDKDLIEIKI